MLHQLLVRARLVGGAALLGAATAASAQPALPPVYQWATGAYSLLSGGTAGSVIARATAQGIGGDTYSAYRYVLPLTVGGQTFPGNSPQPSAVLVHHNATGTPTGARLTVTNGEIVDIATDASGNLYALARVRGTATFGSNSYSPSAIRPDYLLVKWDAAGAVQWSTPGTVASHSGQMYTDHLTVGAAGEVYVTGAITSPLTFGAQTVTPVAGRSTLFCARVGAGGAVEWAIAATNVGPNGVWPTDIAADPATGSVLIGGSGSTGFIWNGSTVGTSGDELFWMRLDASTGTVQSDFSVDLNNGATASVAPAENGHSYLAFSATSNPAGGSLILNGATLSIPFLAEVGVVARLDAAGLPQWVQVLSGTDSSAVRINAIAAAPSGTVLRGGIGSAQCYIAGSYSLLGRTSTLSGLTLPATGWSQLGFVSARDGLTGQETWSVQAGQSTFNGAVNDISLQPAGSGDLTMVGYSNADTLSFNSIRVTYPAASSQQRAFAAKLTQSYNSLTGLAYYDTNANQQLDTGESTAAGIVLEAAPSGQFYTTDQDGGFAAAVGLGSHTLSLPNPPLYYTVPPVSASPAFTSYGNISGGHDFALQAIPNQQDVRVHLTPVGRARPGFPVKYRATYRNVGTVAIAAGDVVLALDPTLTYLSTTGGGTLAGTTLTTTYANLLPGETRDFDILCQLPTTAVLGSVLVNTATLNPLAGDLTPADNVETNRLTVTGSFDPNDIQVNWATLVPTQVASGEWLEYIIRFQNMGTDTAFTVLLRDSLPVPQLNPGTLQLIAASHNCNWGLGQNGLLNVAFPNIRLPHRGVNTVGSMGFVRFRVRPRTSLVLGDLVLNKADIHFDFNAPITTNTARTEVANPMGRPDDAAAALAGAVWPNPASGRLHVEATLPAAAPLRLTLLDATGRPVRTLTAPAAAGRVRADVPLDGLAAGLYLLRAEAGATGFTRRVVVK